MKFDNTCDTVEYKMQDFELIPITNALNIHDFISVNINYNAKCMNRKSNLITQIVFIYIVYLSLF